MRETLFLSLILEGFFFTLNKEKKALCSYSNQSKELVGADPPVSKKDLLDPFA